MDKEKHLMKVMQAVAKWKTVGKWVNVSRLVKKFPAQT